MSTIKLKRGSGTPPNSSLEQYEVAMDVTAKQLYTSTDGTDVVTLSNEYTDVDAVSAIESADLTLAGNNVAEGGFLVSSTGGGGTLTAKRIKDGGVGTGPRKAATIVRDLDTVVTETGFDNRGPSVDFQLISDSGNLTQDLGSFSFLPNNDTDNPKSHFQVNSFDAGAVDLISRANPDEFKIYGKTLAQNSALITNTYLDDFDNQQGDDSVVPLTVKSGPNTGGAVVSEFWNVSEFSDSKVKLRIGLEDSATGDLTSHAEIRTVHLGDRKNLVLGLLDDNGGGFDFVLSVSKDTVNDNEKKVNISGELKVDTDGADYNQCIFTVGDMTNRSDIFMNGLNSSLNWGAGTIPNNAEIFQQFIMSDDTQGDLAVGFFGAQYASADNGFLSTMKFSAQQHGYNNEATLGVNGKNAFTDVPFKYASYTTTERNALTVDAGTMIYNSTTAKLNFYTGSAWEAITSA